jgi:hypothetical protein
LKAGTPMVTRGWLVSEWAAARVMKALASRRWKEFILLGRLIFLQASPRHFPGGGFSRTTELAANGLETGKDRDRRPLRRCGCEDTRGGCCLQSG